jgi:hypothetical protein
MESDNKLKRIYILRQPALSWGSIIVPILMYLIIGSLLAEEIS